MENQEEMQWHLNLADRVADCKRHPDGQTADSSDGEQMGRWQTAATVNRWLDGRDGEQINGQMANGSGGEKMGRWADGRRQRR